MQLLVLLCSTFKYNNRDKYNLITYYYYFIFLCFRIINYIDFTKIIRVDIYLHTS